MEKNVQEALTRQFHRIANLMQRNIHGGMHQYKDELMHRGQAMLLGILYQQDGQSQKELVEKMNIRPSSLGELVARLEQNGCVTRRAGEKDRRISNVFLTDTGRATAEMYIQRKAEVLDEVFSGLTTGEQLQLTQLLDKLTLSLEQKAEQHDLQKSENTMTHESKIHCTGILQPQKR